AGDQGGAQGDAGGGVAAARLADDLVFRHARELACGLVAVRGGGDDPGPLGGHRPLDAVEGLLQQGTVADEGEELLGAFLPGARQLRVELINSGEHEFGTIGGPHQDVFVARLLKEPIDVSGLKGYGDGLHSWSRLTSKLNCRAAGETE